MRAQYCRSDGPSTLSVHSRGLKIYAEFAIRSQRNGREWEGSVVTKVVNNEGFLVEIKSFHLGQIIFDKVLFLSRRHSKEDQTGSYQYYLP